MKEVETCKILICISDFFHVIVEIGRWVIETKFFSITTSFLGFVFMILAELVSFY